MTISPSTRRATQKAAAGVCAAGPRRVVAEREVPALGLGCMRLSNPGRPDRSAAVAVIHAALDAGVRFLDTADVYGLDETEIGHNERLVREAVASWSGPRKEVLIATKVGMARAGTRYSPVGKAGHIRDAGCARLEALGVEQLDLLQLHLPDPRVKLSTTARALAKLKRDGIARHIGVCNVTLPQLRAVMEHVEVASVQVKLNPFDVEPLRNGVVEFCAAHGIPVIAHSPVGGHKGVRRLVKDKALAGVGQRHGVTATQVALAWLLDLVPGAVVIPGATSPRSIAANVEAVGLALTEEDRARLDGRFSASARARRRLAGQTAPPTGEGEIVIVMGYPAAGKTSMVTPFEEQGYERLNRDTLGGRLKDLLPRLSSRLAEGHRRFVMDNTYPARKSRAEVLEVADLHDVPVRCVWVQTSEEEAQVNATLRMLGRYENLLGPDEIKVRGKDDPNLLAQGRS